MTLEQWIEVSKIIEEMQNRGYFMAIWSPGGVTDGRRFYEYSRWRAHFQKGAMLAAPTYEAEGYGNGATLLEALNAARAAVNVQEEENKR